LADLKDIPGLQRTLRGTVRQLKLVAVWRAFWPGFALIGIYLLLALSGWIMRMDARFAALLAVIFWGALSVACWRGWQRYQPVHARLAYDILDQQSELQPLQGLGDRPVRLDPEGLAIWQAHQIRLKAAAKSLRVPPFWKIWRQTDPFYTAVIGPAFLVGLACLNLTAVPERMRAAMSPDYGSLFGAQAIRIEAWVTPPGHTGRPPVFLSDEAGTIEVPSGSVVTLRAQAPGRPRLRLRSNGARQRLPFEKMPDGAYEVRSPLTADTEVAVMFWGQRQSWTLITTPDAVPEVSFVTVPVLGDGDRTDFEWMLKDDYGVTRLELVIQPEGSDVPADQVPVDMGRAAPREDQQVTSLDLTRQRWAGARVSVWLRATDGAGQVGESDAHEMILPEKLLLQPLARAIQDVRVTVLREQGAYRSAETENEALKPGTVFTEATRRLILAPDGFRRASLMLEAMTYGDAVYFEDVMMYVGLRSAQRTLEAAQDPEQAVTVASLLWALALRAEYGSAADALAALQAARAALEEALRDGASEEEIRRRMQAFKDAAQRYVAARMAEAMARGMPSAPSTADSAQGGGPGFGGQDFSDMLDALEDLTETGAADQARQLLADITNLLENLEFQQGSGNGDGFAGGEGDPGGDELPEDERELTETMQELLDLLREQRELNDDTLAEQRGEGRSDEARPDGEERPGPNLSGPQGGADGGVPGARAENGQTPDGSEAGPDGTDLPGEGGQGSLVERQDRLGDRVGALGDQLRAEGGGDLGIDDQTLRSIERAQRRAGQALSDGNALRALRNQEQATQQLRELAEGLADQLDALRADRLGDPTQGEAGSAAPFGMSSSAGINDSNSVDIPSEIERQRARDILEELRRRFGDSDNDEERAYLERLLDRF
jgi:hypothetical protein